MSNKTLVTVLAFIYVPLNLATSIFGMNIYQLNKSGQSLWVFLATALIALFVTGSAWYLAEQVNSYLKWREAQLSRRKDYHLPPNTPLKMRINMLIWSLLSPYRSWMVRRGVLWRLLTNNDSRLTRLGRPRLEYTAADLINTFSFDKQSSDQFLRRYQNLETWVWMPPSSKI